ncbi:anthranilate synthase component I family protein [Bhargavaea beijingensis]|uniref:anthranilate synthase component I family protein n=1 Tax=Bhargavaea beijingensis TaxID=426756 RepID=UPI0022240CC8|nr:anthranilate synthase component I family protein [Bhargavaea beijingensis]MCW1928986.1 anthranilate synthase component I family protein [Bhargavaea beijingensis]
MSTVREQKGTGRVAVRRIAADALTPVAVFGRLKGQRKFMLESSGAHDGPGRYSYIGQDPVKTYRAEGRVLEEWNCRTGRVFRHEGEPLGLLQRLLPRVASPEAFPFAGGAVGAIGYGAGEHKVNGGSGPDVLLNVYSTVIVFDHLEGTVSIVRTDLGDGPADDELDRIESQILSGGEPETISFTLGEFTSDTEKEAFEEAVRQGIDAIEAGELYQVVLSRELSAPFSGSPFGLYRRLRRRNPSPYMYIIDLEETVIVGTSPESVVKAKDGILSMNPIAGTRRRGKDRQEDRALETELLADPKELAEHDMLVDLGRNDIAKTAVPGTVKVTAYQEVVRYEHVMHLVSEVEGQLKEGADAFDAIRACLPAGTVTGAPKGRAMALIDRLEPSLRGLYGGSVGYIGFNGNMDMALAIRTFFIRDGIASVRAGAGVVHDSRPELEFKETENKARSLTEVVK